MSGSGLARAEDGGSVAAGGTGREPWPNLRELLEKVAAGEVALGEAEGVLCRLPFGHLGFARIDHHRWIRTGLAEAVYGPGKTPDQCAAIIAGMEGTLPSAIGGLTAAPIIAVPTSVGYGSSLQGHTALLGMLASCAQGITVMGIDNGFGAACAAARILARIGRGAES